MDVTNFRFQIANFRFQIVARRLRRCARIYARGLPATRYSLPATPFRLLPADYADLRGFVHILSLGGAWGGSPFPFHLSFSLSSFPETERKATKNIWKRGATAGDSVKISANSFRVFPSSCTPSSGKQFRAFASSRTPGIPSVRGKIFAVTRLKFRSNAAKIP